MLLQHSTKINFKFDAFYVQISMRRVSQYADTMKNRTYAEKVVHQLAVIQTEYVPPL